MRATDNRYAAEREKFDLAMRMIRHEARTGTIRACTGFTEDRIRKICESYFTHADTPVRRRRGKTPSQIAPFVNSAVRQSEASLLGGLLFRMGAAELDPDGRTARDRRLKPVTMGNRFCDAYEAYRDLHPDPQISFEWGWNLYQSLIRTHELRVAWCSLCEGPYVHDAYALDYERCPFCELKDQSTSG